MACWPGWVGRLAAGAPVRLEPFPMEQVEGSAGLRIGDYKVDHSVCVSDCVCQRESVCEHAFVSVRVCWQQGTSSSQCWAHSPDGPQSGATCRAWPPPLGFPFPAGATEKPISEAGSWLWCGADVGGWTALGFCKPRSLQPPPLQPLRLALFRSCSHPAAVPGLCGRLSSFDPRWASWHLVCCVAGMWYTLGSSCCWLLPIPWGGLLSRVCREQLDA